MNVTRDLAEWAATWSASPSDHAREAARHAVHDVIACMVAGAGDEASEAVRRTIAPWGGGAATVFGSRNGAPAPWAALVNGTAAHALDFDDNFTVAFTHATAVLIPALLPLAEEREASGRALLDAYLVGLEMHAAVGLGVNRVHYDKGWHGTSTIGTIGTAAACGRLLGLDTQKMTNAISVGVSMASGPKVQFGTMAKPFHAGMAAKNAVLAACLAESGLEARDAALEGGLGFKELFAGAEARGWAGVIETLGQPLAIERIGLSPKRHPCCGSAHKVLDEVIALKERHGFEAHDVTQVDCLVGYGNARNLMYDVPDNEMQARFCLPYCVAVALLRGGLSLADFTPAAVQDPHVRRLLPLTRMRAYGREEESPDPREQKAHEVRITLKDGRVLEASRLYARGTLHDPFEARDRSWKFKDCCAGFLPPADLDALARKLETVDELPSVRELTRHLSFEAGGDRGERLARRGTAMAAA